MKKALSILSIILLLCVCFVSCDTPPTETVNKTPIDLLTEDEKILFDALAKVSANFYEPSAVKVLEIGDYQKYCETSFSNPDLGNGTYQRITVKLQGENRVGGTLNHCYVIRLKTQPEYIVNNVRAAIEEAAEKDCQDNWDTCERYEYPKTNYKSREEYKEFLTSVYYADDYCTESDAQKYFGMAAELSDNKSISVSAEDKFSVTKINKALKYYWDERLGNN